MKFLKWFKWIFSIVILVIGIVGIVWGTIYILNNNGLKKQEKQETKKIIEKVTTNENRTNLSEIYNIYLNNEKHKVKIEYQIMNRSDESLYTILYIYFDGKKSLEKDFVSLQDVATIKELFVLEDSLNLKITENDFKILKGEETEYLLVNVGIIDDTYKYYYYLINNNGDIIDDKGILVKNSSKDYLDSEGNSFDGYYNIEEKTLAKVEDNVIYALEEKREKKKINLVEYKYYFKDKKLNKEKVKVYEDLKLNTKDILKKD